MDGRKIDSLNNLSNEDLKLVILIHSAFTGASVASVVQISSREQMTLPLQIAAACFAVCIPFSMLVVLLLNYRLMQRKRTSKDQRLQAVQYWPNSWWIQAFRYLSYTAGFGGFLGLFWHFHAVIGIIFIAVSLIAMGVALAAEYYKTRPFLSEPASRNEKQPGD